jgi:hypothetical protein
MAEEIIYNIKADTKDAEKGISKLNKAVGAVGGASAKSTKGLGLLKKGVKGIGVALKSAGIGLVVAALGALFEVMRKNQKVLDAITTATNFIQVAFTAVTDAVSKAYDSVKESTGGFDALKKVMGGLLTLAITPLKLAFYELNLALQAVKLGYEKMFGDDESVEKVKADMAETTKAIKQVALDAVQAGKDMVNNISEAVTEVSVGVSAVVDEVGKIDPKKLLDTATNMTKLGNNAAIAAAKQAQLVEEYDRQAESLRQIRDDESLSIEERKKANDELGKVLKKQEEAMLKQADLQVANARAQYEVNKNQENYIALIDAETNRKGVLAQINGFVSEQKVNQIALLKEERDVTNSLGESESKIVIEKQRANAALIQNQQDRITRLIELNEIEAGVESERLQAIIDNENAGTQAKADAQIALNEFLAKNGIERAQLNRDLQNQEVEDEKTAAEAKRQIREANFNNLSAGIGLLKSLAGKNKTLQKAALIAENAVGISRTIIQTQASNAATIAQGAALAIPTSGASVAAAAKLVLANKVAAGISIATSIAATAKGLSALGGGGSPSSGASVGGGGGASPAPQSPTFNVVGQSPASANNVADNADAQIENSNNNPTRAYVVSTDISSQQQLDRDIESDNTLG